MLKSEPGATQISTIEGRAVVRLKAWSSAEPPEFSGPLDLKRLGPREWLALSDSLDGPSLYDRVRQRTSGLPFAVLDQSAGFGILRATGPGSREAMARSCGLDLRSDRFPPQTLTRTRFAHLAVILHYVRDQPQQFDLYVGRSYLGYLQTWLTDEQGGGR